MIKRVAILVGAVIVAGVAVRALGIATWWWQMWQMGRRIEASLEKEYAPLGKTIDDILRHESSKPNHTLVGAIGFRIEQKAHARGHDSLSESEHKFVAVFALEGEVNNGGFEQFFFNSSGNEAELALDGLRELGASKVAALLLRAMAVFPDGKPPTDILVRRRMMEKIESHAKPVWEQCDREFFRLNTALSDPLLAFAKRRRAEFQFP